METAGCPTTVTISLTNVCQQRCRFCGFDHAAVQAGGARFLDPDVFSRMSWLKDVRQICLCGNGEVLMHPQYPEIIERVRANAPDTHILVYTNGLGLFGRNLEATLRFADSVHVSQNAVHRETYEKIILHGNYGLAMNNLKMFATHNSRKIPLRMSFVAVRENLGDLEDAIDLAAEYGFEKVLLLYPQKAVRKTPYGLDPESYEIDDLVDAERLGRRACERGTSFSFTNVKMERRGLCLSPFYNIQIGITPDGKIRLDYCCSGMSVSNLFAEDSALADIDTLFNNERAQFIRKTVNNDELIMANKMCLLCRIVDRSHTQEQRMEFFRRFHVRMDERGAPIFWQPLLLS